MGACPHRKFFFAKRLFLLPAIHSRNMLFNDGMEGRPGGTQTGRARIRALAEYGARLDLSLCVPSAYGKPGFPRHSNTGASYRARIGGRWPLPGALSRCGSVRRWSGTSEGIIVRRSRRGMSISTTATSIGTTSTTTTCVVFVPENDTVRFRHIVNSTGGFLSAARRRRNRPRRTCSHCRPFRPIHP